MSDSLICVVIDNDDNPWGPFDDPQTAAKWAAAKWPGVPQYDEATYDGHGCWDVVALRSPT